MFIFGKRSLEKLSQAHEELQELSKATIILGVIDFSVFEAHRGQAKQTQYYQDGKSKIAWPDGRHNNLPSDAVDLVPYVNNKLSWDRPHCLVLAGAVLAAAALLRIDIRWGGNWDMDGEPVTDQDFQDLVHFERVLRGR